MKSDSDLCAEIRTEIERRWDARANLIDLQVHDGVVTLTGNLPSDADKWNLRDAIGGLPGVKRVVDETMIAPEPSLRVPQADIARPWFPSD